MDSADIREWSGPWWPEIAVAVLVVALAIPSLARTALDGISLGDFLTLGLVGASAVIFRRAPGPALALAWLALLTHLFSLLLLGFGYPQAAEVVIAITAFGTSRYGERKVLVLSGLSIPGAIALILLTAPRFGFDFAGGRFDTFPFSTFGWQTLLIPVFLTLLLGVPWLLGLVLRTQANAVDAKQAAATARTGERRARIAREQAEVDRGQAEEIAERRVNQARTAREVRDVVGHSLAVILEQAESAESLPEARAAEHRRALADIAFTARQSLEDVNAVLRATRDGEPLEGRSSGGMDSLIDRVRSAGYDVDSRVVGSPHPLPPERAAVALRVLEEMLTNAVKHGSQHGLVAVERHWDEDLRIEVRNSCADPALGQPKGPAGSGQSTSSATEGAGLDGMRRRLESVGGRLDVRRRPATDDSGDETFTATAWLPVES